MEKYFTNHEISKGDKFRIVIEKNEDRAEFIEALRTLPHRDITIQGIFANQVLEEPYNTFTVNFSNRPPIIIGDIDSATINYLDTLRNAVSIGKPYEDYAILYILESDISSSIMSASKKLDEPGMPFDINEIAKAIEDEINVRITNDKEKAYLLDYIRTITPEIESRRYTMFDLGGILDIVNNQSFVNNSYTLGYFIDNNINNRVFTPNNDELIERIKDNRELYGRVDQAMKEGDKEKELEKLFVDEMVVRLLSHEDDWFSYFDYDTINAGKLVQRGRKNKFVSCEVLIDSHAEDYCITPRDKKSNSNQQIVVFDPRSDENETNIRLTFERPIPRTVYPHNCTIANNNLTIKLGADFCRIDVDPENSKYKFYMQRLPISKADFVELSPYFSINKSGTIIVELPANVPSVKLGTGSNELNIPYDGNVVWSPNSYLDVSTGGNETNEFDIDFNGTVVKFLVKGSSNSIVPRAPLYLIQDVYNNHKSYQCTTRGNDGSFTILKADECQYIIDSPWFRQLLKGECFLCANCATTAVVTIQEEQEFTYNVVTNDNLPDDVKDAYRALCSYFTEHDLVPSLAYVTPELRQLYKNYIDAIDEELSSIESDQELNSSYKSICKLGVIEDIENKRVFLSPLHPMLVAYQLDFSSSYDVTECHVNVMKLASPLFLLPYISYNDECYRPYVDGLNDGIRTWLFFEKRSCQQQIRIDNLTTKAVYDKIVQFIANCPHLFTDIDTPLKINAIGIDDDENIIIGIIRYIKGCLDDNKPIQKIELHLYVDNILHENFYQKLLRLNSYDLIINEFNELNEQLTDSRNTKYTEKDIIRTMLSRINFYTHAIDSRDENNTQIYYSHLTFYRMGISSTSEELQESTMRVLPAEIGYNGLISQYSTLHNNNRYTMGFGIEGIEDKVSSTQNGYISRIAYLMNELYYNDKDSENKVYHKYACLANKYTFNANQLLEKIYNNSCWVTFISPEVDINFFYSNNLYIVYFTDQLTLNSKYDSITVTNRIEQYNNLIRNSFARIAAIPFTDDEMSRFQENMRKHFNILNGRWLLGLKKKTQLQEQEKVSLVATCLVMKELLNRIPQSVWVPISLEEIVRVTHNIGLKDDSIFSKSALGISGPMSDDLMMMGLDYSDPSNLKVYFYPVEVKVSNNAAVAAHGEVQITKTYHAFKEHIFGNGDFVKNVYRTFFINLMLSTAEKMKAYQLISADSYNKLQEHRIKLLNLDYSIPERMPQVKLGQCCLMLYHDQNQVPCLETYADDTERLAICNVSLSFNDALKIIAGDNRNVIAAIREDNHTISEEARILMENVVTDTDSDDEDDSPQETVESVAPTQLSEPVPSPSSVSTPSLSPEPVPSPTPAIQTVSDSNISSVIEQPVNDHNIKILIGKSLSNNKTEIYYEPNNTEKVLNLNMGITGTSGSGKTQNLSAIIYQLSRINSENVREHPIGMLIFDYKGDYNSEDFCNNVGGTCLFSNFPFNPLHLIYQERDKKIKNIPAITAERVSDALAKSYDSGPVQQARIKQVIIETYAEFGITSDPDTWTKTPPTMNDVVDNYFEQYDATDTVYALFSNLKDWRIFEPDSRQCVSIFEWLTCPRVIDLTAFSDEIKRAIVSLILEIYNNEMHLLGPSKYEGNKREIRSFVVVDEAHQFLSKDYDALDKILREGRSFGVGMILATQNISDFKTKKNDYSTNISSWILHHQVNISKQELYSIFGNTDPNLNQYSTFISKPGYDAITKFGKIINANSCIQYRNLVEGR